MNRRENQAHQGVQRTPQYPVTGGRGNRPPFRAMRGRGRGQERGRIPRNNACMMQQEELLNEGNQVPMEQGEELQEQEEEM